MIEDKIIQCDNVSKVVATAEGQLTILNDISFAISKGETVAIVGQSGSGKTTLLSLLAGLDLPSMGSVQLFDQQLEALDEDGRSELRNRSIGFVFQAFHLLPGFTALENVMVPIEIQDDVDPQQRATQLLKEVGMSHRLDHFPATLSGGEQQRVAIARAFATQPPMLLADEPTGNLDAETGQTLIDLLFKLNAEQGTTLILVTHDEALASRCSRRFRLDKGQLQVIE
ncbi:MAG: ABC transporter ATP-binding protein [Gammaproteobacteria bacterium]